MKLTTQYKIILITSILIIILLILYFLINSYLVAKIEELNKDIYDSQVTYKIYEDQKNNITKIESDYKKVKDDSLKLSKVFIVPDRALDFISALENIASENRITQQINLQEINKNTKDIQKISIQLNLDGDYFDIIRYINKLEALEYYINITHLNFSQVENATRLNITADSFWKTL